MGTNRHRAPRPRRNDPQVAKRKSGGTMMLRVSSSCCSRRGSRSHKLIVFESLYSMDGDIAPVREFVESAGRRVHAVGLYGPRRGGIAEREGLLDCISVIEPRSPKDSARLADKLPPTLNRRCRAELCAAVHFYDHLAAHGCRRRVHGDPPPEGLDRGRTEHQYIAAVTKHGLPAAGLPTLDNASHIVPVMIRDADRCNAASDLLLNRLPPTDQLFDRPDRNRASAHHPDSAS